MSLFLSFLGKKQKGRFVCPTDFETRVSENKESARAALANVESIEEMIRQAGEKTRQAAQARNIEY